MPRATYYSVCVRVYGVCVCGVCVYMMCTWCVLCVFMCACVCVWCACVWCVCVCVCVCVWCERKSLLLLPTPESHGNAAQNHHETEESCCLGAGEPEEENGPVKGDVLACYCTLEPPDLTVHLPS